VDRFGSHDGKAALLVLSLVCGSWSIEYILCAKFKHPCPAADPTKRTKAV
jgi:hypothetical protein